ncbi:alpha/beta hydrolase [Deinococcus hopiensis]|uniref:Enterochelin esterase n=1 Tax=Deinococcus hopiensis KR-140 TaxID=695939 RepID=A0A1W1UVK1_9DEIO|nr:alpha/beta hydrolase-fold protein [Deinococcus hopiensis]SMB84734.1 Enterochelin esterase [Deinococcus hopiensis KR-140]
MLYSAALKQDLSLRVYLPPGYSAGHRYPVVYLMHPYGGDETFWLGILPTQSLLDELLRERRIHPLIVVSPDYRFSFGVNSSPARAISGVTPGRWEDYLIRELIPYIDAYFSTVPNRTGRSVGGISMGGYAALFLGLRHPALFGRIGAHSAALWDGHDDQYTGQRDWLYPSPALRGARDPFSLLQRTPLKTYALFVDVGKSDALQGVNEHFVQKLKRECGNTIFMQKTGGHDLTYWRSQLRQYLMFYGK